MIHTTHNDLSSGAPRTVVAHWRKISNGFQPRTGPLPGFRRKPGLDSTESTGNFLYLFSKICEFYMKNILNNNNLDQDSE